MILWSAMNEIGVERGEAPFVAGVPLPAPASGCALALVPSDRVDAVGAAVAGAFAAAGFGAPSTFEVRPADGARRLA